MVRQHAATKRLLNCLRARTGYNLYVTDCQLTLLNYKATNLCYRDTPLTFSVGAASGCLCAAFHSHQCRATWLSCLEIDVRMRRVA